MELPWIVIAVGYAALVALLTVAIDRFRPRLGRWSLIVFASLPVPALILLTAAVAIARIGPAQPGEIDAGGMAAMAFFFMSSVGAGATFWLGFAVSFLVERAIRR